MSRNLASISCHECPGAHEHIVIEGPIRPVTEKEDPGYFEKHEGLLIAEARCVLCHTLYFAWVDWPNQPWPHWHLKEKPRDQRFCDLSYRHSFDDEPASEDLPVFAVETVTTFVRKPREGHPYLDIRANYDQEGKAAYEARKRAAVNAKVAIADELALAAKLAKGRET